MRFAYLTWFAIASLIAGEGDLSVSVNGATPEVRSGVPLLISATHGGSTESSWPAEAVTMTITAEDGAPVTLTPVLRTAEASNGISRALWTVSPDEVRNLAPGHYSLRIGDARATFRIKLQEASTDVERERDVMLQARYKAIDGRVEEAMNDASVWLSSHPTSIAALVLKADLHESAGQWEEALACISRAVAATGATADHVPAPLLRRQVFLLERRDRQ